MSAPLPSYRRHKASGQAIVTLCGRDFYLGAHGTPASKAEYDRRIGEWLAAGRRLPDQAQPAQGRPSVTIAHLVNRYTDYAKARYARDGKPGKESLNIALALQPLVALFASLPVRDFGPRALKGPVREWFAAKKLSRQTVNKWTGLIRRCFKWGVSEELVPPGTYAALCTVQAVAEGESSLPESPKIGPVDEETYLATLPHLSPQVRAMIELLWWTGMRPGEVCLMRTGDIDRTRPTWIYRPERHKMKSRGGVRQVRLGPHAQAVLAKWLRADPAAYLFQPCEVVEALHAERRSKRESPRTPSQERRGRRRKPRKVAGQRYTTGSLGLALRRACKRGKIAPWGANQCRHAVATRIRAAAGVQVAAAVLGHDGLDSIAIYAEQNERAAEAAMAQHG